MAATTGKRCSALSARSPSKSESVSSKCSGGRAPDERTGMAAMAFFLRYRRGDVQQTGARRSCERERSPRTDAEGRSGVRCVPEAGRREGGTACRSRERKSVGSGKKVYVRV